MRKKAQDLPKEGISKTAIEKITGFIDASKKLLLDCLIIIVTVYLLIFLISSFRKKKLVIHPLTISNSLQTNGYTGDIVTIRLIERVKQLQSEGSSFYKSKQELIPSWDNQVEEVSSAVSSNTSELVKFVLNFFDKNSQNATGEIIKVDSGLQIKFRINGDTPVKKSILICNDAGMDTLLTTAAEYILRKIDPYLLAGYYFKKSKNTEKSLEIIQEMINSGDKEKMGFAYNLRGLVFFKTKPRLARKLFYDAIGLLKYPWISYNNLGVLYDEQAKPDSAILMFKKAIELDPDRAITYFNYGNVLYNRYINDSAKKDLLDSAKLLIEKAIEKDKTSISFYASLGLVLHEKRKLEEEQEYYEKCLEMASPDYVTYFALSSRFYKYGRFDDALRSFSKAEAICVDEAEILQIKYFESSVRAAQVKTFLKGPANALPKRSRSQ